VFGVVLFVVSAIGAALAGGGWRPVAAGAVLVACGVGVFALNVLPSIVQVARHGTDPAAVVRSPTETETYGLRISQLYAPRQDHRISVLATLADDSQGTVIPSERGQQLGIIGAFGLSVILVVFVVSALARRRSGWWSGRLAKRLVGLGLLALACMLIGTVSSYSLGLSAVGLRNIRAWNRISIVIAFCALAGVALLVDRAASRVGRAGARPTAVAGAFAVALLVVGVFDQTSPADRPDYAGVHARYTSDKAFFQAVADRLPPGTAVFELPHMPFPEVPSTNRTAAYDPAKAFLFQPQLAWSFGFMRGRHPDYPLAFRGEPAAEWLRSVAAIGFRGLVLDRYGYADDGAQMQADITATTGSAPLPSPDGRYAFFNLCAYADRVHDEFTPIQLAATANQALSAGPITLVSGADHTPP
jgi:phosphoglycerol transferase